MEWFPRVLTRHESDALARSLRQHFHEHGWGLWAVEVSGGAEFIGCVGLARAHATLGRPAVEVGWRLAADHWGQGYAPEAAAAAVAFGFGTLALNEIVSFTAPANLRSRRVMEKLGMTRRASDDFDHPRLPTDSPLRRHVLYRLTRQAFVARGRAAAQPGIEPAAEGATVP